MNNTLSANNSLNNDSYVLTAIVLVYNGERYLQECLNSLVNQTLDNLEILLINDASTDDSLSICKRYEKLYDNVRLIDKEKNEGLATSANLGISLAKGEYVILVDNDDIIPNYAYEKLYTKAKETNADICTGKANFIKGSSQFEFDFRETFVWEKEQVITDVNDFPELFEDAFYWNKIIRKSLLIENDIKLPIGMIYADRHFAHMAYVHANKIAVIPDCVYEWRQIKSSLSQGRRNTDNFINRLDSYDMDLDFLIKKCPVYFKYLLRRVIVPIRGVLNSEEFENVVFNRVRFLIKNQEKKFENLYDNDLDLVDNLCAFLISNNYRFELKELLTLDLNNQRDIYIEHGVSYWNLPLFRNTDVPVPDSLFKIKYLINQFVTIEDIIINEDKIIFSNIKIPKYMSIKKLQIVFMGVTNYNNVLADNILTFDLNSNINENGVCYNLEILSEELSSFEFYDIYLKAIYGDDKSNKIRINESSIKEIHRNAKNMGLAITSIGNVSLFVQNLKNQFRLLSDDEKLSIVLNNKDEFKKNLRMLIRKDSTKELIYFDLNNFQNAFELNWKYFLDPRSEYSLFLTSYNDEGQLRKNIRLNEKFLDNFTEKILKFNNMDVKIFKAKNKSIKIQTF